MKYIHSKGHISAKPMNQIVFIVFVTLVSVLISCSNKKEKLKLHTEIANSYNEWLNLEYSQKKIAESCLFSIQMKEINDPKGSMIIDIYNNSNAGVIGARLNITATDGTFGNKITTFNIELRDLIAPKSNTIISFELDPNLLQFKPYDIRLADEVIFVKFEDGYSSGWSGNSMTINTMQPFNPTIGLYIDENTVEEMQEKLRRNKELVQNLKRDYDYYYNYR